MLSMRRSFRSLQSVGLTKVHTDQFSYVCQSCRHDVLRQRISQLQSIRSASTKLPFTERVRRKIWGTDNPPGLEDPYGGPSYFERRQQQARAERGEREGPEAEPLPPASISQANVLQRKSARTMTYQDYVHERYENIGNRAQISVPTEDPEKTDPKYVPAETWDGLEHVGGIVHWSKRPSMPKEKFRPYLATFEKATTQEEILSALHQAVVEVITLNDSVPSTSNLSPVAYTPEALASISSTSIELDNTGNQVVLRYEDGAKEKILKAISDSLHTRPNLSDHIPPNPGAVRVESSQMGVDLDRGLDNGSCKRQMQALQEVEDDERYSLLEEDEILISDGETTSHKRTPYNVASLDFLTLPLESPEQRFQIIKRLSQLTGHRIPDPVLASSKTLMPVYKHLLRDSIPKPKKLADRLLAKQDIVSLPNVHIMARRETPVDKDKQVGRWKIIEAELQSKGLPVPGKLRV